VTLMDQVTREMGTYQIDANGFIVPQNNGGENLAIASLVAGQPWTMTVEPFADDATPGADMHQRMLLRQISNVAVYVINSTGFMFATLFSAKQTPASPALGTMMQFRRVPAWNIGDDPTKPTAAARDRGIVAAGRKLLRSARRHHQGHSGAAANPRDRHGNHDMNGTLSWVTRAPRQLRPAACRWRPRGCQPIRPSCNRRALRTPTNIKR